MKTGVILLARLSSSRLPGKVLIELCGQPILGHVIDRLKRIPTDLGVIVATTENPKDDAIEGFCRARGVKFFRGSEANVLDRCINAMEANGVDAAVRLGADSPLADAGLISAMMSRFLDSYRGDKGLDYLTNSVERRYPLGLDADILTLDAMKRVAKATLSMPDEQRRLNEDNVVPFIQQNPSLFRTFSWVGDEPDHSSLRWTLDTPEDFDLIRHIYEALYPQYGYFDRHQILELLASRPDWSLINANVRPVTGYWSDKESAAYRKRFGRDMIESGASIS